jgi:UDP:flavonoid glycosyltransferase YjiC (YdhE family)
LIVPTAFTHIVISTMGTSGDVLPFITMGRGLIDAGYSVAMVTNACYAADVEAAGISVSSIDTPDDCDLMIRDGARLSSGAGLVAFVDRHVTPRIACEVDLIRRHVVPERTVLLVRAAPGFAARIVADAMGLPLVGVMLAPAHVLGWPLYEEIATTRVATTVNALRQQLGLAPVTQWRAWLSYDQQIGLWPEWYGPIHELTATEASWGRSLRLMGFMLGEDPDAGDLDPAVRDALQPDRPNVLITGGTGFFSGPDFFRAAIEGCRLAGCRPLIVCRQRALIPADLLDTTIVVPAVRSLAAVMRHVSAVCHHGGMGTLGQALAAGVPQLVMAFGGDRPDNANRLRQLGVAEVIGPMERNGARAATALQRLLQSATVSQRCRDLARGMREGLPMSAVGEVLQASMSR